MNRLLALIFALTKKKPAVQAGFVLGRAARQAVSGRGYGCPPTWVLSHDCSGT